MLYPLEDISGRIWAPDPTADIWARKVGGHLGPNLPISDVTCRGIFGGPRKTTRPANVHHTVTLVSRQRGYGPLNTTGNTLIFSGYVRTMLTVDCRITSHVDAARTTP